MSNYIQTNPGTPIFFLPSGNPMPTGIGVASGVRVDFAVDSLATGVGYLSNQYDLGPGPRTSSYSWRGKSILGSGAGIANTVDIYISTSNSIAQDGSLPSSGIPITSTDKRRNLMFCGSLTCDSNSIPPDPAVSEGYVEIFSRYISIAWFNNTVAPLGTGNSFTLTPVPDYIL